MCGRQVAETLGLDGLNSNLCNLLQLYGSIFLEVKPSNAFLLCSISENSGFAHLLCLLASP